MNKKRYNTIMKMAALPAAAVLLNSILPSLYNKYWNSNVIKNTGRKNTILLSFDDGPDERYLSRLLQVLAENKVHAAFFIVAENAERNPRLIKQMQREGHTIAFHSLSHKNEMFHSYFYTKKEFERSTDILRKMGCTMNYYRPPWGQTNLFSGYFSKKNHMKMILWDVMAQDWSRKATIESICSKLRKRVKSGSILCLHDAGENSGGAPGAPLKMIEALKIIIPELKQEGYEFITPDRINR